MAVTHVDPLEPRRLLAVGLDPTFGDGGRVPLSEDYFLDGVLATHGEVYVDTYHAKRGRRQIFKYSDAGVLDTSWGTDGYIVPHVAFGSATNDASILEPLVMVRDPHTGGLLLGGSDGTGLVIERHTASGAGDVGWGAGGQHVYTEAKTALTIASLTALPHDRVLLAFKREQQRGDQNTHDLTDRKGGADDVALLMFDRRGRYDRSFNGGHPVRVAAGSYRRTRTTTTNPDKSVYTDTRVEDFGEPTFGDVQFRSDGSLRVIATRLEAHTTTVDVTDHNLVEPGGPTTTSGRFVASVESTAVSADGALLPRKSQAYVLKRGKRTTDGYTFSDYASYVPVLGIADGPDNGIAVLGNSDVGSSIIRLAPGRRSRVAKAPTPRGDDYVVATARTPSGDYVFRTGGPTDGPRLFVLDSRLVPVAERTFVGDFDTIYYTYFTADDANRILTIESGRLHNVEPHLTRYP